MRTPIERRVMTAVLMVLLVVGGSSARLLAQADAAFEQAWHDALATRNAESGNPFAYYELGHVVRDDGAVVYLEPRLLGTDEVIPGIVDLAVAVRRSGAWAFYFPGDVLYNAAYAELPDDVTERIDYAPYKLRADPALVLAEALRAYQFPWEDARFGTVTRSYERHGTGQIDFDLSGGSVAAAKGGTIVYVNDSSPVNGLSSGSWWYWNVVIIEHGEHEFSLYGHLAQDSVPDAIKALCSADTSQPNCDVPVTAGTIIGREGNTGTSSADHLHFETAQQMGTAGYVDGQDFDQDGDRLEIVYAGYVYAEQNVGISGFSPDEGGAWAYGTLLQAAHQVALPEHWNPVRNADFSAGTDGWRASGQLSWWVEDGVMYAARLNTSEPPNWARFYQDLGYSALAHAPLEVRLLLGNESGYQKMLTVTLLNAAGRDYGFISCDFGLSANAPLRAYTMRGETATTWANMQLSVSVNPPDGVAALVDDVQAAYLPSMDAAETACLQPD